MTLKVRRAGGAARDTVGVRVRQRVAGHGRLGVRDVAAVARVLTPHDPVSLERSLEGGGGVCALHVGVILGDYAEDLEREVDEDGLDGALRVLCVYWRLSGDRGRGARLSVR